MSHWSTISCSRASQLAPTLACAIESFFWMWISANCVFLLHPWLLALKQIVPFSQWCPLHILLKSFSPRTWPTVMASQWWPVGIQQWSSKVDSGDTNWSWIDVLWTQITSMLFPCFLLKKVPWKHGKKVKKQKNTRKNTLCFFGSQNPQKTHVVLACGYL